MREAQGMATAVMCVSRKDLCRKMNRSYVTGNGKEWPGLTMAKDSLRESDSRESSTQVVKMIGAIKW
eukprot:22222-Eustigmatos_ZCMA.PRE.1